MRHFLCKATNAFYRLNQDGAVERRSSTMPEWHSSFMIKTAADLFGDPEERDAWLIEVSEDRANGSFHG